MIALGDGKAPEITIGYASGEEMGLEVLSPGEWATRVADRGPTGTPRNNLPCRSHPRGLSVARRTQTSALLKFANLTAL